MGSGAGAIAATLSPPARAPEGKGLKGNGGVTADSVAQVAERVALARARIDAAGGGGRVTLMGVTKGFGPEVGAAALAAGVADLGENYAQELLAKAADPRLAAAAVEGRVRWHFLGPLQTNKAARLAPVVSRWHGIDRLAAGAALARRRPGAEVFVEVNVARVPGRPGCPPEGTEDLVAALDDAGLRVVGLMTVAPGGDAVTARATFRWLAGEAARLGLKELSMGMSDDFEAAVAEGATMVRLGRFLFGPRPVAAGGQR